MTKEETKISKDIQDWLKKAGYFYLRLNSGVVRVRGGMLHLCPNGTPDLEVFDSTGCIHWVEIKTNKGVLRPEQVEFRLRAFTWGHGYILARSVDQVKRYFHELR